VEACDRLRSGRKGTYQIALSCNLVAILQPMVLTNSIIDGPTDGDHPSEFMGQPMSADMGYSSNVHG
jgi:hypothetical protein